MTVPNEDVADHLRRRVIQEREARTWSIRKAAGFGSISNETWGRYEETGNLTPAMRRAIAKAYRWSADWPDDPPPFTPPDPDEQGMSAATVLAILQRLDDVVVRLEALADRRDDQDGGTDPPASSRPDPRKRSRRS